MSRVHHNRGAGGGWRDPTGGLIALVVKKLPAKTGAKSVDPTGPGWEEGCPRCSFLADHIDGSVVHLAHRDVTLLAVSRAPLPQIDAFRKRMGWRFKWVSSLEGRER